MTSEVDFTRTVNFRVRRPSRGNGLGVSDYDIVDREERPNEPEKEDECFQTDRRDEVVKK